MYWAQQRHTHTCGPGADVECSVGAGAWGVQPYPQNFCKNIKYIISRNSQQFIYKKELLASGRPEQMSASGLPVNAAAESYSLVLVN